MPEKETKGEENIRTAQEERERRKNSLCSLSFFILNTGRKCSNVPLFFRPSSLRG